MPWDTPDNVDRWGGGRGRGGGAEIYSEGTECSPVYHIHTLQDLSEDDVLAVEPPAGRRGEKELASVRVRARISHAQHLGGGIVVLGGVYVTLLGFSRSSYFWETFLYIFSSHLFSLHCSRAPSQW